MKTANTLPPEVQRQAIPDLEENRRRVLETFALFTQENFNRRPSNGGWSAAHIARHFILSEHGMADMLRRPVEHTDREPDARIPAIKNMFLDFTTKMDAPAFSVASDSTYNLQEEMLTLKAGRDEVIAAAKDMDLSLLCLGFDFPGFGFFTRYEWLYFNIYHTQRHMRQLENILGEW